MRPAHPRPSLRQRVAACLALLAMVLSALLPALSHAVVRAPGPGEGWVEVCSSTGMLWVRVSPDGQDPTTAPADAPGVPNLAQCAWCTTHGPGLGLPPAASTPLVGAPASALPAGAAPQPPHLPPLWRPSHSRAPPLPT